MENVSEKTFNTSFLITTSSTDWLVNPGQGPGQEEVKEAALSFTWQEYS